MPNNCQIQTPQKYITQMLNYVKYKDNVFGKRVLENSCGEGNVLVQIVKRYIDDAKKRNISDRQITEGLEQDIVAYEIDKEKIDQCKKKLNRIIEKKGLTKVNWNIINDDFLKESDEKYDFIIGNPPYITYHDLSKHEREYLRQKFKSCENGRFDYCYAFIEKSIDSLKENGKLIYLLPYSVIKNKFAGKLRKYMSPFVTGIYDYTGIKVFPDAITSSVVLLIENKKNKDKVVYHIMSDKSKHTLFRGNLGDRWKFIDEETLGDKRFGDYFDICNSVATLYNKAYVIERYSQRDDYYYIDGAPIEMQLVYQAISTKSYNRAQKNEENKTAIIFPYRVENGEISHYSKDDFEKKFPKTTKYLKTYKKGLEKRKSEKNALWFEYGRSQAINRVLGEKLVIPMVITNNVSVCEASFYMIPYAGYFVKLAQDSTMTLDNAREILESKDFYDYVKTCGTPTTPTSYRISVDDIKEYRFQS